ncbi:MAG: fibronectin type III domain-containing protein [Treponema sp.]|jgi:fibronectin type 3 domain-containing protein|nr:fibronectin type III domain-containing protein [Treponema sp.]
MAPPSGLTVSSSNSSSITLSWNAVTGAVEYFVYRATSNNGIYTKITTSTITTTFYTDTELSGGTIYYYKVSATNSAGEGAQSGYVSALTAPAVIPPPATPSGISVAGHRFTNGKINGPGPVVIAPTTTYSIAVSWSAVSGASTYNVYYATSVSGTYTLKASGITGTSKTIIVSSSSTSQYIKVSAVNSNGESAQSAPYQVTTWTSTSPVVR